MNKIILFLIILLPTVLYAQGTKKINDRANNETFYVLKSDKITKNGEYTKLGINNKLLVKGYYKLGIKDSIWECFDNKGIPTLSYNFTGNKLIFYKPSKDLIAKKFTILNPKDSLDITLTRPPILLGGDNLILSEFARKIHFKYEAIGSGKSGYVCILFTVDKQGKTSNYRFEKPIGFGIDEEAVRVLKLLSDYWLPGLSNDEPVDVELVYQVFFTL